MKITYTERRVNLRDNFKQRVEKKLSKFDKVFSDEAQAFVVVTVDKNSQTVEITIRDKSMVYRVEKTMPEMNDAVDKCVDALGRQLRKNKAKLEKRLRQGSLEELTAPAEDVEVEAEEDYTVVRTKKIPVKPITVDEAILEMNMVGHKFYMFTNAETGAVNVVYLRDDGRYGLLIPTSGE